MEIDATKCDIESLSAGVLLLDLLSLFHPELKTCFVSCAQFVLDLESSGDDLIGLWSDRGFQLDREFYYQVGLLDIVSELGQEMRDCLPVMSPEQVLIKGKINIYL